MTKLKLKPYIQPFEKQLAFMELTSLVPSFDLANTDITNSFEYGIDPDTPLQGLAEKLTYWETIESSEKIYTLQSLRESTVNVVRNGIDLDTLRNSLPLCDGIMLPNRRCLRYATHGIHEYKGKFFPQLVRSLINISLGNNKCAKILDPMCGSGTTLVESVLDGHDVTGIDMNPLSILVSKTKCEILAKQPQDLENAYIKIRNKLLKAQPIREFSELDYLKSLPQKDQDYMNSWFEQSVLCDLDQVMNQIRGISDKIIKNFFLVVLSNILRKVSWQKDDDLRVRREALEGIEHDAVKEFLEEAGRSVRHTLAFMYQNANETIGSCETILGDTTTHLFELAKQKCEYDLVITSPPYATALPYLDTDRLSLSYLGLLPREKYRESDSCMIGNREISQGKRELIWSDYLDSRKDLPASVVSLISKIEELNKDYNVGFRRKNLPALLGKYFLDMRIVFQGLSQVLKKGANAFFVVGDNFTIAGGEKVNINTIDLLCQVAKNEGFQLVKKLDMEMLVNRNVHKKNATNSESILMFIRE